MNKAFVVVSHVEEASGNISSMNIRAFTDSDKAEEFADKLRALIQPDDKEEIEIDELTLVE